MYRRREEEKEEEEEEEEEEEGIAHTQEYSSLLGPGKRSNRPRRHGRQVGRKLQRG